MSSRAPLALAALILGLAGCERDEIVNVDPDQAPGQSAPTLESVLQPAAVPSWIDTVFSGFANAAGAPFILVEGGTPDLVSRGLVGFDFIIDSVALPDTISPVETFQEGRVVVFVDTVRSQLASAGSTLQLLTVDQTWDVRSADWELAVDSLGVMVPWTDGPGGTVGDLLGEVSLDELSDSIILPLGARSDSLIRLWSDTAAANTGLALVVADSGRVVISSTIALQYESVPELDPDTVIDFRVFATATTFIYDRSSPPVASGVLRLGGVEGWRSFLEITLPDSVMPVGSSQRFALRGSTVNEAELVLRSLPAPAPPFGATAAFEISAFRLADDFATFGPKTPVGSRVSGSTVLILPDSLDPAETVSLDITERLQAFADVAPDSTPAPMRLVLRALVEATGLGFWEFGAVDGDPSFAPTLRIVFTPQVEFRLP